jgi:hypothetical protein
VGSPVGWHPVEHALPVSAGVENITGKSTPKKDVLVTTAKQVKIEEGKRYTYRPAEEYIHRS